MNFAENLTALRRAKGETQEQLGEVLGISGKTVSKWEAAASEPDLSMLVALSRHFAVSVDELLGQPKPTDAAAMLREEIRQAPTAAARMCLANSFISHLINAVYGSFPEADEVLTDAIPAGDEREREYRTIGQTPLGTMVSYHMREVKAAAMVWRNEADFAWLRDDRERMAAFFSLFADPDMLALYYVLERMDFSEDFTAAYAAERAGITEAKASALLEKLMRVRGYRDNSGTISRAKLETLDGERTVYNFNGDGTTMAILSLARPLVTSWGSNLNTFNASGKMIGERGSK